MMVIGHQLHYICCITLNIKKWMKGLLETFFNVLN